MPDPSTPFPFGLLSAALRDLLLARAAQPPLVGGTVVPFPPRRGRPGQACEAEIVPFSPRLAIGEAVAEPAVPGRTIA